MYTEWTPKELSFCHELKFYLSLDIFNPMSRPWIFQTLNSVRSVETSYRSVAEI